MKQLCLGDESFDHVIDRIAERACAITDGLPRDEARRLIELAFRSRVRQTDACGHHPECGAVGTTAGWDDPDPDGVPEMIAAALVDLTGAPRSHRRELESRLAREVRDVVAPLLVENPSCGKAAICRRAVPIFPFGRLV